MNKLVVIALVIVLCFFLIGCNTTEPPDNNNGQDTTSHSFTFQTWTFGEHSSSVLYDVAIINDTSIWAVGEIYLNDSLGQPDTQPYAVAYWDGSNWSQMKVPYHDFNQTVKYPGPLFSVAYIDNNIYVVSYANLLKWTGNDWEEKAFFMEQIPFDGQVIKIWGFNENNIYCVGRNGAIYYYFGTSWQKLQSGTDVDIQDIWGDVDSRSGEKMILAIASLQNYGFGMDLLKIDGLSISKLDTTGLRMAQSSIWFKVRRKIYVVGDGVFFKNNLSDPRWQQDETQPLLFKRKIRGQDCNDIFIVGDFGILSHYNGKTWHHYRGNELPNLSGGYYSVSFEKNKVVAVGELDNGQAIILCGNR